jgi:enoyl-[acyl-carrier protein] reductase III
MQTFRDKVALVTGSGRGIGRAIATNFARLGADVVVNFFRNRAPAEQTAEAVRALDRRAWVIKADIGDLADLERMFKDLDEQLASAGLPPGLDILVHNAASGYNRPALEQKPRGWEWTMNINARALLFMAQQAAPRMRLRGGGAIVSITSPGSRRVLPDYVVVGASKAALETVTRYLAVELSADNIIVNAVSPGVVLTDALKHFEGFGSQESIIARATSLTPAGRLVTPEDVAGVVAFLCAPEANMIRGQVIEVDGGASLPGK